MTIEYSNVKVATPPINAEVTTSNNKVASVNTNTYVLQTSGNAGISDKTSVPTWLSDAISTAIADGTVDLNQLVTDLSTALTTLDAGVQQQITSVQTANESTNQLLTTEVSRLDDDVAGAITLANTKVTPEEATATALQALQTEFNTPDTIANSTVLNLLNTTASDVASTATDITNLQASFSQSNTDTQITIETNAAITDTRLTNAGIGSDGNLTSGAYAGQNLIAAVGDTEVRVSTTEGVTVGTHIWDGVETLQIGMKRYIDPTLNNPFVDTNLEIYMGPIIGWAAASTTETAASRTLSDLTIVQSQTDGLRETITGTDSILTGSGAPDALIEPYKSWITSDTAGNSTATRYAHTSDVYIKYALDINNIKVYDTAYRFIKTDVGTDTDVDGFRWAEIQDQDTIDVMNQALQARDLVDHKRRVFTDTPYPPYESGDLWVETYGTNSKRIHKATVSKVLGDAYTAVDWELAATDDTYADTIASIVKRYETGSGLVAAGFADGDITVYTTDIEPASPEAYDLWAMSKDLITIDEWDSIDPETSYISDESYIYKYYDGSEWRFATANQVSIIKTTLSITDVRDLADGKVRIFNTTPFVPYDEGDLWILDGEIFKSSVNNTTAFDSTDWGIATKYTDDTVANTKTATFKQATAPTALTNGDIWIDTSDNNHPKVWDGNSWVSARDGSIASAIAAAADALSVANTALNASDGTITVYYLSSDPTISNTIAIGDIWVDIGSNPELAYRWRVDEIDSIEKWMAISDTGIAAALIAAQTAQTTADGKIVADYVDGPTGPSKTADDAGDLWYDTADGNKPYYWTGSAWATVQDESIEAARIVAQGAQDTINGYLIDGNRLDLSQASIDVNGTTTSFSEALTNQINDSAIAIYSGGEAEFVAQTTCSVGDLFIKTVVDTRDSGTKVDVVTMYECKAANTWAVISSNDNLAALADLTDGKRTVFGTDPSIEIPVGVESDLWIPSGDGYDNGTPPVLIYKKNELYIKKGTEWILATTFGDDIVNAKDSLIDMAKHDGAFNAARAEGNFVIYTDKPLNPDPYDVYVLPLSTLAIDDYDATSSDIVMLADTVYWDGIAPTDAEHVAFQYWNPDMEDWILCTPIMVNAIKLIAQSLKATAFTDSKARIFNITPYPPYDVGDLWVQGTEGDILHCITDKADGSEYSVDDWGIASKYPALIEEKATEARDYADNVTSILETNVGNLIDGKSVSYFQDTEPFTATSGTIIQDGDMWFKDSTSELYVFVYTTHEWRLITDPIATNAFNNAAKAQDTADGKRVTFRQATIPVSPITVGSTQVDIQDGDMWIPTVDVSTYISGEIYVYETDASPVWQVATKFTNALDQFTTSVTQQFTDIGEQVDKKIEYWFQPFTSDPSDAWTGTDASHDGDVWYRTDTTGDHVSTTVRYSYSTNKWLEMTNKDAIDALADAAKAQATADGKMNMYAGYISSTEPVSPAADVYWLDTSIPLLKQYVSSVWTTVPMNNITSIGDSITRIINASGTAGDNVVWSYTAPNTWKAASSESAEQAKEWAGGASSVITDPNTGVVTGWNYAANPDISQFTIRADSFKISNSSTPGYSPFSVDGTNVWFNGKVNFSNQDMSAYENSNVDTSNLANKDMSNVTTIDGGKITTGTVDATKINTTGLTVQEVSDGSASPTFEIKADGTAGPTNDSNVYGASIKGGDIVGTNISGTTITGSTIISTTMNVRDLVVTNDAGLITKPLTNFHIKYNAAASNPLNSTGCYFDTNLFPYNASSVDNIWGEGFRNLGATGINAITGTGTSFVGYWNSDGKWMYIDVIMDNGTFSGIIHRDVDSGYATIGGIKFKLDTYQETTISDSNLSIRIVAFTDSFTFTGNSRLRLRVHESSGYTVSLEKTVDQVLVVSNL